MTFARASVLAMIVTIYTPQVGADPINGNGRMSNGEWPYVGAAACGPSWPFGTLIVLPEPRGHARTDSPPRAVVCKDHGHLVHDGIVDLVWITGHVAADKRAALLWGRQPLRVEVWPSRGAYLRARAVEGRIDLP